MLQNAPLSAPSFGSVPFAEELSNDFAPALDLVGEYDPICVRGLRCAMRTMSNSTDRLKPAAPSQRLTGMLPM